MLGQDFDGDGAVQAGVSGLVDFAHATSAQLGLDLVGAEAGAGSQWHGSINGHPRLQSDHPGDHSGR